jgi:hypothetical protein
MELIDMFTQETRLPVVLPDNKVIVPHLISRGYLPTTPINPLVAISLRTLEFYKLLQQRKPSFSVEAFTKVLCDLYGVSDCTFKLFQISDFSEHPYRRRWCWLFGNVFETFLSIMRATDIRVNAALNCCSEHWRVLNTCSACMYELEGEPSLRYRFQISMDGNDLQKRMKDKGVAGDVRELQDSDYWISAAEVDQWARPNDPDDKAPPEVVDNHATPPEATTADDRVRECVKNWKAAQSDTRKKVMGIFDESGWFACACRHGIVL